MLSNEVGIKTSLIAAWQKGGVDALVKVMAADLPPDPARAIGYCTQIKFLAGRSPLEMERAVGLRDNTKLAGGAAVYLVKPLPSPAEFHFRGYSNTPEGISTSVKKAHEDYPPGLGVPQWELTCSQARLVRLAVVPPGQAFRFVAAEIRV